MDNLYILNYVLVLRKRKKGEGEKEEFKREKNLRSYEKRKIWKREKKSRR